MTATYAPLREVTLTHITGTSPRPANIRQRIARVLSAATAAPTLLHAAAVAAVLVLANQAMDAWGEHDGVVGWFLLWLLAVAALALLAGPSRQLAGALKGWQQRRRQAEQDALYWESAIHDPRIMAEIRRAMGEAFYQSLPVRADELRWRYLLLMPAV
jgi:hypothetical protein